MHPVSCLDPTSRSMSDPCSYMPCMHAAWQPSRSTCSRADVKQGCRVTTSEGLPQKGTHQPSTASAPGEAAPSAPSVKSRRKRLRVMTQPASEPSRQQGSQQEKETETYVLLRSWGATCAAVLLPHGTPPLGLWKPFQSASAQLAACMTLLCDSPPQRAALRSVTAPAAAQAGCAGSSAFAHQLAPAQDGAADPDTPALKTTHSTSSATTARAQHFFWHINWPPDLAPMCRQTEPSWPVGR